MTALVLTQFIQSTMPRDNPHIFNGSYICPPNVTVTQAPGAVDEERQRQLYDFTEALLKSIDV